MNRILTHKPQSRVEKIDHQIFLAVTVKPFVLRVLWCAETKEMFKFLLIFPQLTSKLWRKNLKNISLKRASADCKYAYLTLVTLTSKYSIVSMANVKLFKKHCMVWEVWAMSCLRLSRCPPNTNWASNFALISAVDSIVKTNLTIVSVVSGTEA